MSTDLKGSLVFRGQNSGHYTWNIRDQQLIQNILNAQNKELIETRSFIMANLEWRLLLYPNGYKHENKGSVKMLLKLMSMPCELDKFVLSYSMRCNKTMSSWTSIVTYTKSGDSKGCTGKTLLLSEWQKIKNLNDLSITVTIKINNIVLNDKSNYLKLSNLIQNQCKYTKYQSKQEFVYKIDGKTFDLIQKCHNEKAFESPIFDNMWRLLIYPNGDDRECEGYFGIYLKLCVLPPFVSKIKTKYTIKCMETNTICIGINNFDYANQGEGDDKFLSLIKIIKLCQCLTFIIDIEIINISFIDTKHRYIYRIYDEQQIANILSTISITHDKNDEIMILKHELHELHKQNNHMTQTQCIFNAKLNSLAMNMKENNNMIHRMQTNMNTLSKHINDLRLVITEEISKQIKNNKNNKNNTLEDIKKEMESMKININKIMNGNININHKTFKIDNKKHKKHKEIKEWMINMVELPEYIDVFIENGFESLDIIKRIKIDDLIIIGINKRGHQIKICHEIDRLNYKDTPQMIREGSTEYLQ